MAAAFVSVGAFGLPTAKPEGSLPAISNALPSAAAAEAPPPAPPSAAAAEAAAFDRDDRSGPSPPLRSRCRYLSSARPIRSPPRAGARKHSSTAQKNPTTPLIIPRSSPFDPASKNLSRCDRHANRQSACNARGSARNERARTPYIASRHLTAG